MTRARRFPVGRPTSDGYLPGASGPTSNGYLPSVGQPASDDYLPSAGRPASDGYLSGTGRSDGFDLPPASQGFGPPRAERVPGGWEAHDARRDRRPSFSPQLDAAPEHRPLYARMLRLRHVAPSGVLCFVFLEGAIALGALLALAELVSWWGVLVLPMLVALMVKLNDVIAGSLARAAQPVHRPGEGLSPAVRQPVFGVPPSAMDLADDATTRLPSVTDEGYGAPTERPRADRDDLHQQWLRQSATRRYE